MLSPIATFMAHKSLSHLDYGLKQISCKYLKFPNPHQPAQRNLRSRMAGSVTPPVSPLSLSLFPLLAHRVLL